MVEYVIPLSALAVSVASVVITTISLHSRATREQAHDLSERITKLEEENAECEEQRAILMRDNYKLMQKLYATTDTK